MKHPPIHAATKTLAVLALAGAGGFVGLVVYLILETRKAVL